MKKTVLSGLIFICYSILLPAQQSGGENGLVNWLSFEEAQERNKQLNKPFIIDFYTDWCGWCKHMMKTTYSNAGIAAYINQNFYPVKFNAESKDTIEYNGKIYKPLSPEPRTPHELAVKFLGQSLSYPSTVFVTNNFDYNLLAQGFLEDKKLEPMLVFMVENAWRTVVFDEFNKYFTRAFYDTTSPKKPVKVHTMAEVEKLRQKKPKKVLVSVGAPFCNTGYVMNKTTFTDSAVAAVIDKYFYLVQLDATSTDTIIFKNEKHHITPVNNFQLHSLAIRLTGNRFSLPALCILDEQLEPIDVLNYYQSPEHIAPILAYIGSDEYKKKTFDAYMQEYMKKPAGPVK